MDKEQRFCQSCGMPLTPEIFGTNADGSQNEEYCILHLCTREKNKRK